MFEGLRPYVEGKEGLQVVLQWTKGLEWEGSGCVYQQALT